MDGPIHENGQLLTTQSVRYHSLSRVPYDSASKGVSCTSEAKPHGVLGRMSMYETFSGRASTSLTLHICNSKSNYEQVGTAGMMFKYW